MSKPYLTIEREDAKKRINSFIEKGKSILEESKKYDQYWDYKYSQMGSFISTDSSIIGGRKKIEHEFKDWATRVYDELYHIFEPRIVAQNFSVIWHNDLSEKIEAKIINLNQIYDHLDDSLFCNKPQEKEIEKVTKDDKIQQNNNTFIGCANVNSGHMSQSQMTATNSISMALSELLVKLQEQGVTGAQLTELATVESMQDEQEKRNNFHNIFYSMLVKIRKFSY